MMRVTRTAFCGLTSLVLLLAFATAAAGQDFHRLYDGITLFVDNPKGRAFACRIGERDDRRSLFRLPGLTRLPRQKRDHLVGRRQLAATRILHPQGKQIVERRFAQLQRATNAGRFERVTASTTHARLPHVSTAAALNQTSNIFVFLFAAWFLKERITWLRGVAICAAMLGALLVTFG